MRLNIPETGNSAAPHGQVVKWRNCALPVGLAIISFGLAPTVGAQDATGLVDRSVQTSQGGSAAMYDFLPPRESHDGSDSRDSRLPPDALHADGSGSADADSVRTSIEKVLSTLTTVALQEKISRFAEVGGTARKLDSFEAEVSVAEGTEQYAAVQGHHRTYHHVSEIGGLWSFGEIVTMLRTTRDIMDSSGADRSLPEGEEASDQTIIRFKGPSADHQWFVTVHGRVYWLDFEGCIRISRRTGAIESLTWTSGSGPSATGIASIFWNVNFHAAAIAGKEFTMPADSIFRVVRRGRDQKAEWNLTQYEAVGRYGSTVSVRYGQ